MHYCAAFLENKTTYMVVYEIVTKRRIYPLDNDAPEAHYVEDKFTRIRKNKSFPAKDAKEKSAAREIHE